MITNDLIIENARFMFKPNFAGEGTQYNNPGNRNFSVMIEEEDAEQLKAMGWNVKEWHPKNDENDIHHYLDVKVNFGDYRPPKIVMVTSHGKITLTEETVQELDNANIKHLDVAIRPYNWSVNGKEGTKGYLKTLYAVLDEDEFEAKYQDD